MNIECFFLNMCVALCMSTKNFRTSLRVPATWVTNRVPRII